MARRLAAAFVALLAAVGTVWWAATTWGFYPVGLLVLMGAAIIVLLGAVVEMSRASGTSAEPAPSEGSRRHDARIVADLRAFLPRQRIEWLRSQDFGGSAWRADYALPFLDLRYRFGDVEHQPLDPDLARALGHLLDANDPFTEIYAQHTFPNKYDNDARDTGWSDVEGGKYGSHHEIFAERQRLLNQASYPVAEAYDEFVDVARRKLLLDTSDDE